MNPWKHTLEVISITSVLFAAAAGAQAQTTWYVDDDGDAANGCTTWDDACPELQTALSLASSGDEIWVAAGVYKPDYDLNTGQHTAGRAASFQLLNDVALYGGFDGSENTLAERAGLFDQTILSGDLNGDDTPVACAQNSPDCVSFGRLCVDDFCIISDNNGENSYHVTTGSGTDSTAILDGFTVSGGNADNISVGDDGGGMYNTYNSSPTVANCTFSGNSATDNGGGMFNYYQSSPTVTNCTFSGNSTGQWGGGMCNYYYQSSPTVTNCTFSGNSANNGGGMYNRNNSSPTVTNCTFSGNSTGQWGGGMCNYSQSSPTVANCAFSGNSTANNGGGMFNYYQSSPTVTNCTFSGNSANNGGGMSTYYNSSPTVTNCILWGDTPNEIIDDSGSITTVGYSDIEGGFSGTGNIDADPLFVDADGPDDIPGTEDDDLRLLPGSPCIDAADNDAVPPDTADLDGDGDTTEPTPLDLDGNPRFVDDPNIDDCQQAPGTCGTPPIVDMGAYELAITNQPPVCDIVDPDPAECQGSTTTIPLNGSGSYDPDPGDTLTYLWATNCPGGSFDDNTSVAPTFTVDSVAPCPLTCNVDLTVDDGNGDTDSCDAAVTIEDTIPPSLTVDTTPIEVIDTDCSGDELVELPTATAADVCGTATVTDDAPSTFPAGQTTTVTYAATDECGNASSANLDVTVLYGADIMISAAKRIVGPGTHPGSTKEPLVGIEVCAYDKSEGSCVQTECGGSSHNHYECIVSGDGEGNGPCDPVSCCTTDLNGECTVNIPPGDYVIVTYFDSDDDGLPDQYLGAAADLLCGEQLRRYLQLIVHSNGRKSPGKTTRLTGSELLIIEPEYVLWDQTEQSYPFVFETIGNWGVTTAVTPPEGFVADYSSLSEYVDNEIEAVQFTITEVGSDIVPTETTFQVHHNGRSQIVHSRVGIMLTPDYARSRGFDVAKLRAKGLIKEHPGKGKDRGASHSR